MNEPPLSDDGRRSAWRLQEVCVLLSAPSELVLELVEYRGTGRPPEQFDRQWLTWLGRSLRLQRDLGDALAAAFISDLIERNAELERRISLLERLAGVPLSR
jgi:hypothetical protein